MNRQLRTSHAGFRSILSAALIVGLAAAGVPAAAQGAPGPAPAGPSALRASIDRAVEAAATAPHDGGAPASLSADESAEVSKRARRLQADPVAGQSPGGGKVTAIVAVVGLAVTIASTYWYFKFMKDQQEREQGR